MNSILKATNLGVHFFKNVLILSSFCWTPPPKLAYRPILVLWRSAGRFWTTAAHSNTTRTPKTRFWRSQSLVATITRWSRPISTEHRADFQRFCSMLVNVHILRSRNRPQNQKLKFHVFSQTFLGHLGVHCVVTLHTHTTNTFLSSTQPTDNLSVE